MLRLDISYLTFCLKFFKDCIDSCLDFEVKAANIKGRLGVLQASEVYRGAGTIQEYLTTK